MSTTKKIPMRKCVGCQEMKNKKEMLRVLKTAEGEFILDATGRKNGRGAYLCFSGKCLQEAIKNKGLERSFKQAIPKEIYENLEKELEKLFSYTAFKDEITIQDVEDICTTQITNRIFDMVDAVAKKQQKKALDYYYDLVALKEPPLRILALLTRQFRILLEVKDLMKKGLGRQQIAQSAGLHPYVAGKCMDQSKGFSGRQIRSILEDAADMEEAAKTGRLDNTMCVEIFIVKYSAQA